MDIVLWIAGGIVALLITIVIIGSIIGRFLEPSHVASGSQDLPGIPPARVYEVLTDIDGFTAWRPDLKSIERLPDRDGQPVWKEQTRSGPMVFQRTIARPGEFIHAKIVDNRTISGGWDIALDGLPDGGGTRVTVTERATLHNMFFVFMSKMMNLHGTLTTYLQHLAAHLGVAPAVTINDPPPPPRAD